MKGRKQGQKSKRTKGKKKAVVVASDPLLEKRRIPSTFKREEAAKIAKTIFLENAVMAPAFHKELNELRERIPPNVKLGIVYSIPPFAPWSLETTKYEFVPCTSESLLQQGCPKDIYGPFDTVDTTTRLYAVVACPFLEEGETNKANFSVYWESGAYVLAECVTLQLKPGQYYPTLDKSWSPSTHFGVCAMPGCFARNARFQCSRCKRVFYCGPECQAKHWPRHQIHECVIPSKPVPTST